MKAEKKEDDDGSDEQDEEAENKEGGSDDDSDDQLDRERQSAEADIRDVRYNLENLILNFLTLVGSSEMIQLGQIPVVCKSSFLQYCRCERLVLVNR